MRKNNSANVMIAFTIFFILCILLAIVTTVKFKSKSSFVVNGEYREPRVLVGLAVENYNDIGKIKVDYCFDDNGECELVFSLLNGSSETVPLWTDIRVYDGAFSWSIDGSTVHCSNIGGYKYVESNDKHKENVDSALFHLKIDRDEKIERIHLSTDVNNYKDFIRRDICPPAIYSIYAHSSGKELNQINRTYNSIDTDNMTQEEKNELELEWKAKLYSDASADGEALFPAFPEIHVVFSANMIDDKHEEIVLLSPTGYLQVSNKIIWDVKESFYSYIIYEKSDLQSVLNFINELSAAIAGCLFVEIVVRWIKRKTIISQ